MDSTLPKQAWVLPSSPLGPALDHGKMIVCRCGRLSVAAPVPLYECACRLWDRRDVSKAKGK